MRQPALDHVLVDVVAPVSHQGREQDRHDQLGTREGEEAQHPRHLPTQASRGNQDEALDQLGMLVCELHGHSAAQRLTDHSGPGDSQDPQQVAQPRSEGAQGVVALGFGRLAVAEQVGGDDIVMAGQQRHRVPPGARAAGHAVDQQDGRPLTTTPVADLVAVDGGMMQGVRLHAQKLPHGHLWGRCHRSLCHRRWTSCSPDDPARFRPRSLARRLPDCAPIGARNISERTATDRVADRVYTLFFAAQAVFGVLLWGAFALSRSVRSWVELVPEHPEVTEAFALGDLGLIVVGSALSSWALVGGARWAVPASAFTAGAVAYPTLYLAWWVAVTGSGGVGLAVMVPVCGFTCWLAWIVWRSRAR